MSRLVFRLAFTCESDAFKPDAVPEIVSILRTMAERIENDFLKPTNGGPRVIRDINGVVVGTVQCLPEPDAE